MAIYDPTFLIRSGVSPDNLWTAAGVINDNLQSIADSFERAVDGLSYQNPVLDKDLFAAPTTGIVIGSSYRYDFISLGDRCFHWYSDVEAESKRFKNCS
jgi:hypothetical protein